MGVFFSIVNLSGEYRSIYIEDIVSGCGRDGSLLMYLTLTKVGRIHAQLQTIDVTIGEVENPDVYVPVYVYKAEESNDASVHPLKLKGLFPMKHGVRYQLSITMYSIGSSWKDNLLTFCVCEGKLFWN